MRTSAFAIHQDPRALAKVDLRLGSRFHLHAHERRIGFHGQMTHEPFNGIIAARESLFADQVLINPLGAQPRQNSRFNPGSPRLALTAPATRQAGGTMTGFGTGGFSDPAGRMAGFDENSDSEPGGGTPLSREPVAGFDRLSRTYLPTVSRLIPSSRAIRRLDQPLATNVDMECCRLTFS